MNTVRASKPRWRISLLPTVLAILASSSWALLFADMLPDPFASIVLSVAGPVALAGIVLGIVRLVKRDRPLWLPLVGTLLSAIALSYIGLQFVHILAILCFC
jgi:hypothetical protein